MPHFVVFRLGQPTKKVSFDTPPVRVGRDPENDIVVSSDTVSREHAVFMQDEAKRWHVGCVSETNPIVVNGTLVTASVPVADRTEVLVGNDCLVLFVVNPAGAAHLFDQRAFAQVVCQTCWWTGMMSPRALNPRCPRCATGELAPAESMTSEVDGSLTADTSTRVMSDGEVRASYRVMRDAKRAVLACTDGRGTRRVLNESEPLRVSSRTREMPLKGIVLGGGFSLTWDGRNWALASEMFWPRVRVNGEAVTAAKLRAGDVIEVGGNRFELTSE